MNSEKKALDIHKSFYEILVNYDRPYERYQVSRRLAMETLYMEAADIKLPLERRAEIQQMLIILSELK